MNSPRISHDVLATRLEQLPVDAAGDRTAVRQLLAETVPDHSVVDVATRSGLRRVKQAVLGPDGAILDHDHNRFLRALAAERGPAAAAAAVRERRLRFRCYEGEQWFFAVPYDRAPAAYLQIAVNWFQAHDYRPRLPGTLWSRAEDLLEAIEAEGMDALPAGRDGVQLAGVTDIATHLDRCRSDSARRERERIGKLHDRVIVTHDSEHGEIRRPFAEVFPEAMVAQPHRLDRLFRDWSESSAGSHRFCERWYLDPLHELFDADVPDGIPQWADGLELPRLRADDFEDADALAAGLEDFDRRAGYPMAWFFYMVHGNRLDAGVGEVIVEALCDARLQLPRHDARVLLRWAGRPYAF